MSSLPAKPVCPDCPPCRAPDPVPVPVSDPVSDPVPTPTPVKPNFSSKGSVGLGESDDMFVHLAYTAPFMFSAADSYITSEVSRQLILGFKPSYFQIPYIYSASDNLVNGKYTSSSKIDGDLVITEYVVPYTGMVKEEYVLITTYFHNLTNILFYEVPRVFSYNSIDQASVAVTPNGKDFVGKVSIPSSFVDNLNNKVEYVLTVNIDHDNVVTPLTSASKKFNFGKANVALVSYDPCANSYPCQCNCNYPDGREGTIQICGCGLTSKACQSSGCCLGRRLTCR